MAGTHVDRNHPDFAQRVVDKLHLPGRYQYHFSTIEDALEYRKAQSYRSQSMPPSFIHFRVSKAMGPVRARFW
jgi:hypothetical protein